MRFANCGETHRVRIHMARRRTTRSRRPVGRSRRCSAHIRTKSCSPAAARRPAIRPSRGRVCVGRADSSRGSSEGGRRTRFTSSQRPSSTPRRSNRRVPPATRCGSHDPARGQVRHGRSRRREAGIHRPHEARLRHALEQRGRHAHADQGDRDAVSRTRRSRSHRCANRSARCRST